jgi:hypothetical protein
MLLDRATEQEERTSDRQPDEPGSRRFPDQHPRCDRVAQIADEDEAMCPDHDRPPLKDAAAWHSHPERRLTGEDGAAQKFQTGAKASGRQHRSRVASRFHRCIAAAIRS